MILSYEIIEIEAVMLNRMLGTLKIPSTKRQITNKFQAPILKQSPLRASGSNHRSLKTADRRSYHPINTVGTVLNFGH
jgi:hypothetical protein